MNEPYWKATLTPNVVVFALKAIILILLGSVMLVTSGRGDHG
jgi:hypothetical protein